MRQSEQLTGMIIALGQFPLVQQGMLGGSPERSLIWKDPRGFWKKARPDEMPNHSGDFVDLKTTASVLYRDTQYSIAEYGDIQQAAVVMGGRPRARHGREFLHLDLGRQR
ncbi:hypothetical protein HCN58_17735 [Bradyrhizobium sp. WSM 1791]|uniref:Uncharacterized protein n=1 Tax=Bradyrhizobium australiense TaxID=2721161 RepID=A0A7Y4GTF4_9BRAD|nr:hypothetical protein [Bradyrhizobium australiense]